MNISIAVNRSKKNGDSYTDEVHYFDIVVWGKTAENLKPYLTKGKLIAVEAHLQQERWEKDGKKNSRVAIHADNIELLGGKSESAPQSAPAETSGGFTEGASSDFPEDIPF